MLFPKADIDGLVQIRDMFRIDASKSFATSDENITNINIYPDFDNSPGTVVDVYGDDCDEWYLDWAYEADGDYTIRVEMISDSPVPVTTEITYTVSAITAAEDNLFSNDAQLYKYESELKRYLPSGRNSWKYMHRLAQTEMVDYLYRNAILNPDNSMITKDQLIGDSLAQWSIFETLILIFQELKTSNSEAFNEKLVDYYGKRSAARKRYLIEYDSNKDGNVDEDDVPTATTTKWFSR